MRPGHKYVCWQSPHPTTEIVITCSHPENLVGAGSRLTYRHNCLFDYVINLACALASADSEIDTTCFSDAAAGLYQPAGGHRHSLELAISVVKSEIASGEDLLPEHVPSALVHNLRPFLRPGSRTSQWHLVASSARSPAEKMALRYNERLVSLRFSAAERSNEPLAFRGSVVDVRLNGGWLSCAPLWT